MQLIRYYEICRGHASGNKQRIGQELCELQCMVIVQACYLSSIHTFNTMSLLERSDFHLLELG